MINWIRDIIEKRRELEYYRRRCERYELALAKIIVKETPHANQTVRNITKIAHKALKDDND